MDKFRAARFNNHSAQTHPAPASPAAGRVGETRGEPSWGEETTRPPLLPHQPTLQPQGNASRPTNQEGQRALLGGSPYA
jgi:hypothetical protein